MRKAIQHVCIVFLLVSIGTVLFQEEGEETESPDGDSKSEGPSVAPEIVAQPKLLEWEPQYSKAPEGRGNITDKIFRKGAKEELSTITFLMMSVMAFLL
ncbi:hypothetical protein RB195_019389 [Necator americanus]|uniref:Uncharacterized protein n=1 Tax=Necator americanus TaxID=51031 RepID=A0ABR1CG59_NECAM